MNTHNDVYACTYFKKSTPSLLPCLYCVVACHQQDCPHVVLQLCTTVIIIIIIITIIIIIIIKTLSSS